MESPLLLKEDQEQGAALRVTLQEWKEHSPILHSISQDGEPLDWRRELFRIDGRELKEQVKIAVPMILANVLQYAVNLISVMFAGHLGEVELAGAALGNSWALVTGYVFMVGLSSALETLCGQAYGAKEYAMLGVYFQASMIVSSVCAILLSIFWLYADLVLLFIGQDIRVSAMASRYLRCLIPGLFAYAILQSFMKFLQTQSIVMPLTLCSLFPLILHAILCYVLVSKTTLGIEGPALATSVTFWLTVVCMILYMKLSLRCKMTWQGFSSGAFKVLRPFLKLAFHSAIMVCLEYWAFEILVLLAGILPNSEINTSLVAMCENTEALAFMITFGFSAAISTRVSNELGAGNPYKAKSAVFLTLKLGILQAVIIMALLVFGHNIWAAAFSDSLEIKQKFSVMTPLLAVSIFFDAIGGVLSGVVRGCGRQHLAGCINLVAFYGVGMPIAIVLAFALKLNGQGLWSGLICGLFSQACILVVITLYTNWTKMVGDLNKRRSISGYVLIFFSSVISCMNKRKLVVTLSTIEAEYMLVTHASKKVVWL